MNKGRRKPRRSRRSIAEAAAEPTRFEFRDDGHAAELRRWPTSVPPALLRRSAPSANSDRDSNVRNRASTSQEMIR